MTYPFKYLEFYNDSGILYFFGDKRGFFVFPNNLKDLDPSCKMDLDLSDFLGRVKLVL